MIEIPDRDPGEPQPSLNQTLMVLAITIILGMLAYGLLLRLTFGVEG